MEESWEESSPTPVTFEDPNIMVKLRRGSSTLLDIRKESSNASIAIDDDHSRSESPREALKSGAMNVSPLPVRGV